MTRFVKLRYIGRKPSAYDNIARSGVTWNGNGDVQKVSDAQAKLLLRFPDQWELVDPADAERVNEPVSIRVVDADGDTVFVDPDTLKKPLEKMTKSELAAYALNRWGKVVDQEKKSKKALIDQIEEWEIELDVVVGRQVE